jgi:hypothetical protein
MDSTAAIAKAIRDLECDEAVKDALKGLFNAQLGVLEQLPKKVFTEAIELRYQNWVEPTKKTEADR